MDVAIGSGSGDGGSLASFLYSMEGETHGLGFNLEGMSLELAMNLLLPLLSSLMMVIQS